MRAIGLLALFLFLPSAASFGLNVNQIPSPNSSVDIFWTRAPGEPHNFTLVLTVLPNLTQTTQNVDAQKGQHSGDAEMPVGPAGNYRVDAFDPDQKQLGEPLTFAVAGDTNITAATSTFATSDSALPTNSVSSTQMDPPPTSDPSPTSLPSNKRAIIIGSVVGSVAFLAILAIVFFLLHKRRKEQESERPVTFHRDMMVREPGPTLYALSKGASFDPPPTSSTYASGDKDFNS